MTDQLFASDDRPQSRGFPIALVLFFLALSFACLRHKHDGWQGADERFVIEADRWELGAPLPWLSWVRVTTTGDAPPVATLPEGRDYRPGLHPHPILLGLAVAFAVGLAWMGSLLWRRLRPWLALRNSLPSAAPLAVAAISGALLGALLAAPLPTRSGLGFALLPLPLLAIALCWRRPRIWLAAAYLSAAILGMEIANMPFEGRPLIDRALYPKQDFLPQLALLAITSLIVAAPLAWRRRVRGSA